MCVCEFELMKKQQQQKEFPQLQSALNKKREKEIKEHF